VTRVRGLLAETLARGAREFVATFVIAVGKIGATLRATCSHPADQARPGLGASRFDQAHKRGAFGAVLLVVIVITLLIQVRI
jgi:hypothetical protein